MPAKSKAQLRAMYAAAAGRSTLGIRKSVGQEFVTATSPAKRKDLLAQINMHTTKSGKLRRGDGG